MTVVVTGAPDATLAAVEPCRPLLHAHGHGLQVLLGDRGDPGKATALNRAFAHSSGDLLVFTDANVWLDPQAIRALVGWFAQARVGAASGRKRALRAATAVSAGGGRAYWSFEAFIKEREALLASVAGADGALYALRRSCYRPTASCADDFALSLGVVRQGKRIAFVRDALA